VRRCCSTESRFAVSVRWLRRGARSWGGVVAVAMACSLLATSARAEPAGQQARDSAAGAPTLAQLESRGAQLSRQYRGQLDILTGTETAAKAAAARVALLDRQVAATHRELARFAAASYEGAPASQALAAFLDGGDPSRVLRGSAIVEYLAQQRAGRQQEQQRLIAAEERARQAAEAKVSTLRQLLATLAGQQQRVKHLLDQFRPQSPTIGDNITSRMREVRDEVDRRFGPFSAIGCYRPGNDGEHPLGRACDFMLSSGGVMPAAANIQLGYNIAAWAQANASRLGIMYIIYRQRIWDIRMGSAGWVPMEDRGSITANHFDHVHISVF
jgi:hypothetical protein